MNPKTSSPSSSDNKLITNETSSSSMIQSSSSSSSAATEKTNQFYSQQQNSSSSSSSDGTLIVGDCHSTVLESNSDANLHKQIKDILNQKKMVCILCIHRFFLKNKISIILEIDEFTRGCCNSASYSTRTTTTFKMIKSGYKS
mgnify:CR=1 FL=1